MNKIIIAASTMRFVFASMFLFSLTASAGFFGPSTYEECILENMKGINNEVAAYSVRNACANKFPATEEKPSAQPLNPPNYYRIDASRGARGRELVNNLAVLNNYQGGIQIMNKNSFTITGILVGGLAKGVKNCPTSEKDFQAIHWCGGVVGSNQTGRVTCNDYIGTFCITGFQTDWLAEPEKFFKETGVK